MMGPEPNFMVNLYQPLGENCESFCVRMICPSLFLNAPAFSRLEGFVTIDSVDR